MPAYEISNGGRILWVFADTETLRLAAAKHGPSGAVVLHSSNPESTSFILRVVSVCQRWCYPGTRACNFVWMVTRDKLPQAMDRSTTLSILEGNPDLREAELLANATHWDGEMDGSLNEALTLPLV